MDLLNDYIFHNYTKSIAYFDDNFEKTALYLDLLSRNDVINSYIKRTQNYEMMSSQYLPCYAFKKFCAGQRALAARSEYPRELRNQYFEQKKFESVYDALLDLKGTKKGYSQLK